MASLYLVTGPWASGKTSVVAELSHQLSECVVFDWDSIIPALSGALGRDVRVDPSTWPGLKAIWDEILANVLAGGHDVVLFGPLVPDDFSATNVGCDSIHCAYLNWPDKIIAQRLRRRGASSAEISDELTFLTQLRGSAFEAIESIGLTPREVAVSVSAWVGGEVSMD